MRAANFGKADLRPASKLAKAAKAGKADPQRCNDPMAVVAQWVVQFALLIYLYTVFGCMIFKFSFFRQLAFIFQMIKIFIIFAGILPCVVHSQAATMFPGVSDTWGRVIVIFFLLILNIAVALFIKRYLSTCTWGMSTCSSSYRRCSQRRQCKASRSYSSCRT